MTQSSNAISILSERFLGAATFAEFLEEAVANRDLWQVTSKHAVIDPELIDRVQRLPGNWKLVAVIEDWCGDGASTIPYVARLAELAPNLELRVFRRDANPDIMDAHLTGTARSIPVVIILDEQFEERGWWGSRPVALRNYLAGFGELTKEERFRESRRWYARDRGRTALTEIVELLEQLAAHA